MSSLQEDLRKGIRTSDEETLKLTGLELHRNEFFVVFHIYSDKPLKVISICSAKNVSM